MSYCYERGLPHSFLLGEDLRWSADDRDKLKAFTLEKGGVCSQCGTAPWEWEEDSSAYEPMIEVCMGCMHKDAARENNPNMKPGSSIVLVPRDQAAKMKASPVRAPRRKRGHGDL